MFIQRRHSLSDKLVSGFQLKSQEIPGEVGKTYQTVKCLKQVIF